MSKKKYLYRYTAFEWFVTPPVPFIVTLTYAFYNKRDKQFIVECKASETHKFRCERRWVKPLKLTDYLWYELKR